MWHRFVIIILGFAIAIAVEQYTFFLFKHIAHVEYKNKVKRDELIA